MTAEELVSIGFLLNEGASWQAVDDVQRQIDVQLPQVYKDFLMICNGLCSSGCLALHQIEALPARNADYEVGMTLPGYFMIGDDGGGQAILLNASGELFEVGMGVMDLRFMQKSASSLEDLLINQRGLTLGERS